VIPTQKERAAADVVGPVLMERALGIDTRTLQSFTGDAVRGVYLPHCLDFLTCATRRGCLPTILGMSCRLSTPQRSSKDSIGTRACRLPVEVLTEGTDDMQKEEIWNSILTPVVIDPKSAAEMTDAGAALNNSVPKSLNAVESWKLFASLGERVYSS